jgi:hypothetical protein
MNKYPFISYGHGCLSFRIFKGKIGLDILFGKWTGCGIELFASGIGEVDITFRSLPNFDDIPDDE